MRESWRLGWDQGYRIALQAVAQRLEAARLGHVWAKGTPALPTDAVERWLLGLVDSRG